MAEYGKLLLYCLRLESNYRRQDLILASCNEAAEVRAAAIALIPPLNIGSEQLYQALTDDSPLVAAQAITTLCRSRRPVDSNAIQKAVQRCLDGGIASTVAICQAIGDANLQEFAAMSVYILYVVT